MTWLSLYLSGIGLVASVATWTSAYLQFRTPWRDTPVGIHLAWFTVSLAVTFTALTLGNMIPARPVWFDVLRALLYTATPVVVIWRVALQLAARKHPLEPRPPKGGAHRHD